MENKFRISLRIKSDQFDFEKLIPVKIDYKFVYNKKGDDVIRHNNSGSFCARSNILIINDIFITDKIEDNACDFLAKLTSLMKLLSVIETDDIKREIFIFASLENQQFGFSANLEFLNLLTKYKYSLSFSGISYL
jgi:hypothetical protein